MDKSLTFNQETIDILTLIMANHIDWKEAKAYLALPAWRRFITSSPVNGLSINLDIELLNKKLKAASLTEQNLPDVFGSDSLKGLSYLEYKGNDEDGNIILEHQMVYRCGDRSFISSFAHESRSSETFVINPLQDYLQAHSQLNDYSYYNSFKDWLDAKVEGDDRKDFLADFRISKGIDVSECILNFIETVNTKDAKWSNRTALLNKAMAVDTYKFDTEFAKTDDWGGARQVEPRDLFKSLSKAMKEYEEKSYPNQEVYDFTMREIRDFASIINDSNRYNFHIKLIITNLAESIKYGKGEFNTNLEYIFKSYPKFADISYFMSTEQDVHCIDDSRISRYSTPAPAHYAADWLDMNAEQRETLIYKWLDKSGLKEILEGYFEAPTPTPSAYEVVACIDLCCKSIDSQLTLQACEIMDKHDAQMSHIKSMEYCKDILPELKRPGAIGVNIENLIKLDLNNSDTPGQPSPILEAAYEILSNYNRVFPLDEENAKELCRVAENYFEKMDEVSRLAYEPSIRTYISILVPTKEAERMVMDKTLTENLSALNQESINSSYQEKLYEDSFKATSARTLCRKLLELKEDGHIEKAKDAIYSLGINKNTLETEGLYAAIYDSKLSSTVNLCRQMNAPKMEKKQNVKITPDKHL